MKTYPAIPAPEQRIPSAVYAELRAWLLANDPDATEMLDWSSNVIGPPASAEDMVGEIIWIILCAGRSAQSARTIEAKVSRALRAGKSAFEGFGYRAKADAIDDVHTRRSVYFEQLRAVLSKHDPVALIDWCGGLSYVGDDTKFQLAKNFGADVCKPDIWLCRLTGFADKPRRPVAVRFPACMALCQHLAHASGDRIATVDSLLWLACNKGVLTVDERAGPVAFAPKTITARSIYEAADTSLRLFGEAV